MHRAARAVAVMLATAAMLACSATITDVTPANDRQGVAPSDAGLSNPATLVPPTTSGADAPPLMAIEPLVAFMDACVAGADLVGPCHCAARRMEGGLAVADLEVLEDRMSGALEFPPELATALVDCREAAPPPAWPDARQQQYLNACSAGSDRLKSLCACSLARAQQVVPAHRLGDYLASNEVQPAIAEFINQCI